jgi:hypothetical protein
MSPYPKYRVTQWLDTSDEAMRQPQATIIYGVQTMREKGGRWMHCATSKGPMHYDTPQKASKAIADLRASDAAAAGAERGDQRPA